MGLFSAIAEGVAGVAGGFIQSRGNERAAETASQGAAEAARIQAESAAEGREFFAEQQELAREEFREARDRGVGALEGGRGRALSAITTGAEEFRAGIGAIPAREIYGENEMSPAQRYALEDAREEAQRALGASGLRGSGRAQAAVLNDLEGRARADMAERNRARTQTELDRRDRLAFEAAASRGQQGRDVGNLESVTAGRIANTEVGTGSNVANTFASTAQQGAGSITRAGENTGNLTSQAANTQGQSQVANSRIFGQTIGNLGAIFADELQRQRQDDVIVNARRTGV